MLVRMANAELLPVRGHRDKVFSEPEGVNATTEVSRGFKLEAVKLVRDRGVAVAQAARDLDLHENVRRKWVREAEADPQSAFPGNGQMKPEQQEIERLRRELARMKAERDILKKAAAYFARDSI
jgi:transposase